MYLFQHILCCLTFFIQISTFICCFSTFSAVSIHFKQFVSVSAHSLLFIILYSNQHIYLLFQHIFCCFNTFQTIVSNFSAVSLKHFFIYIFFYFSTSSAVYIYIYIYFTHTISAHFLLFQHIFCCNRTFLHTNLFNSVNTIAIHNYDRRQTFCETTQIIPKWNTSTHVKEIKYFWNNRYQEEKIAHCLKTPSTQN